MERTKDFILCGWGGVGGRMKGALGDEGSERGRGAGEPSARGLILSAQTHATSCCLLPVLSLKSLAVLGNPHALLEKCEVNTICLSIFFTSNSSVLPSHSLQYPVFPSFYDAYMCVTVCVPECAPMESVRLSAFPAHSPEPRQALPEGVPAM